MSVQTGKKIIEIVYWRHDFSCFSIVYMDVGHMYDRFYHDIFWYIFYKQSNK